MNFTGRYELESHDDPDDTVKSLGIPDHVIKANKGNKIITEMHQNDVFTITKYLSAKTWTIAFTIGKECELETLIGVKFKTTVTLDEGKLRIQFPGSVYTAEIDGDKLIEVTSTPDNPDAIKSISRRI